MIKNYDDLKTKEGDVYELYGILIEDIDTKFVENKYVVVISAYLGVIRSFLTAGLLCFLHRLPWL